MLIPNVSMFFLFILWQKISKIIKCEVTKVN